MIDFPKSIKNILVTGGGGFIGGALIRRLLSETNLKVFNIDKLGYSSDLTGVNQTLDISSVDNNRYQFLKVNLSNADLIRQAINLIDPDIVFHLAAETHVDRSISGPEKFLECNVIGTFNLLEAIRSHWAKLSETRKQHFRFHNVSTDEVFGSLGSSGSFSEESKYSPRNPYSASKAASDHFVKAWYYTYGLPITITNCSNNFGPWQFPDKLIPLTIYKAFQMESIPLYGNGLNIRDWLFVEDHVDALLKTAIHGKIGCSYCIGGSGERTNLSIINSICEIIDLINPKNAPHNRFIETVEDRLGHDLRYSINNELINKELGWKPRFKLEEALIYTVKWYSENLDWCKNVSERLKI